MFKTILSAIAAAHLKLTTILTGIAIIAAILAVPGLQYAHAQHICGIGSSNGESSGKGNGGFEACNANGAAPGNGGFIPRHRPQGELPKNFTPHQCTIGICSP
jgi:hypothetical protein